MDLNIFPVKSPLYSSKTLKSDVSQTLYPASMQYLKKHSAKEIKTDLFFTSGFRFLIEPNEE